MPPRKKEELVCINIPDSRIAREPHTVDEIVHAAKNSRASRIATEFDKGFRFIKKYPKSVTFYGSARFKPSNRHYVDARRLAFLLAKKGYAIVTGGGPGIMEAANRGANEAGVPSIGLNIELPREQVINPYVTDSLSFYYFFSRKTTLSFAAEAYVFYPGGFGTLDEFFEIITLIQTHKIRQVPVILVGSDFWCPLEEYLLKTCWRAHASIEKKDLSLYEILDDHQKIADTITRAPLYE